jgi:hypothetical protein
VQSVGGGRRSVSNVHRLRSVLIWSFTEEPQRIRQCMSRRTDRVAVIRELDDREQDVRVASVAEMRPYDAAIDGE